MSITDGVFYFFYVVTAASALSIVFTRNVLYAALLLVTCLLGVAAIYVLAYAEFVAVTQILIYAGGILVVIIFAIMLTSKISGKPLLVEHANRTGGSLVFLLFLSLLIYFFNQQGFTYISKQAVHTDHAIQEIGIGLMTTYVLPFEIAGVLLLIALIGAAVIASYTKSKQA